MEDTMLAPFIFWAVYISANFLVLILLGITVKYPETGRGAFSLLFAAACLLNISMALEMSWLYAPAAEIVTLPYHFFLGKALGDLNHLILWIIAGCQGLAAIALTRRGIVFVLGCWCGMILFIALLPLGLQAAFPAPVLAALALYTLQRVPHGNLHWGK